MIQKNLIVGLVSLVFITGCATIAQKPEVFKVKKVAVISVYINSVVEDIESSRADKPAFTVFMFNGGNQELDKKQTIVEYAEKSVEGALATVPSWVVVPFEQIANTPAYLAMKKDTEAALTTGDHLETGLGPLKGGDPGAFVAPNNMAFVPATAIPTGGISIALTATGKAITQDDVKHYWGKLASDLGVDAVAIVYFELAYKKNFFSGVRLLGVIASADANVDAGIVAVTKDGTLALNSRGLTGERLAGGGAPMLVPQLNGGETFTLADDKREAINQFNKAIQAKIQAIAKKLADELKS